VSTSKQWGVKKKDICEKKQRDSQQRLNVSLEEKSQKGGIKGKLEWFGG